MPLLGSASSDRLGRSARLQLLDVLQTVTAAKKHQHNTLWVHASGNTNYHIIRSLSTGSKAAEIMDGDGYIPLLDGIPGGDSRLLSFWKNSSNLFETRLAYADDVMPRREIRIFKTHGTAGTFVNCSDLDIAGVVESGTPAATDSDTNGGYNLYASTGAINADAGWNGIGVTPLYTGRGPWFAYIDFWTGAETTNLRRWSGWHSTNPNGSATPGGHYFSLRGIAGTDTNWQFATDDAGSAPTLTDTGVAIAASTRYRAWFWSVDNGASISCQVNESAIVTNSTNMPNTTTALGPHSRTRATTAAVVHHGLAEILLRSY